MSLDFRAQQRTVMDLATGLKIYPPRVLPASTPSDVQRVEFEYPIYRGDTSYAFFLLGREKIGERDGRRERSLVLNIDQGWNVEDALELKAKWDLPGDSFSFLCGLAKGLVGVLALRSHIEGDAHYSALTNADALAQHGIAVPESVARNVAGDIVLAETFVQARNDESGVS